jgi:hypothetical protein
MYLFLMIVSISWILYLVLCDPFFEKQDTYKDIVNAYLFLLFTYFIPAYTLMTPEASVRYSFGFYTIYILGALAFINFVWMIVSLIQDKLK